MNQFSVTKTYESDLKIKGSKFIAFLIPCESKEKADKSLGVTKEIHPRATHHCYAFRVDPADPVEFSNDDGEPSGTAGAPILNTLKSANIVNAICIVVRYYGGTKLGKSGLIEAYGGATQAVVDTAGLRKIIPTVRYQITYPYDQQTQIDKLKHAFSLYEIESEYSAEVTLLLQCHVNQQAEIEKHLRSISHLLITFEKTEESFHIK